MVVQAKYIIHSLVWIGVVAVLSTVAVSSHSISVGEMAYQELWLSRAALVFVVGASFSLFTDKKGSQFYQSVVWSLIIIGGVEAIWGIRQLYGLAASNHSLYALTGSFYNPGPYSGYLAMIVPVCLSEWITLRKKEGRNWIEKGQYYLSLGVLLLIFCVLPAGMSRSAWIAAILSGLWVYGMHHSWGTTLKEVARKHRKRVIPVVIIGGIVLMMAGYALFHLKKDSASGRLLMWKVSTMAIAERPVVGHGMGRFAQAYGDAQESYFTSEKYSETEELVAGSPEYAFNEYLQVTVEFGIFFLLAILLVIGFSLWVGITNKRISACGGVISVLIFAFSSYPIQIPAFAITFYFLLAACVVERSRVLLPLFIVMIALVGGYYWKYNRYDACKSWSSGKMMYNIGAYQSAKEEYEKLYSELKDRGVFLYEYGHCLHKLKEYDRSVEILKEAMVYNSNPMVLNIIGKNFQAKGDYLKAEEWLIRSTHRLPGRIYPYYLLAKLYAEPEYKQLDKLKWAVEVVMKKEPKVQSTAIKEMRNEVKKFLIIK